MFFENKLDNLAVSGATSKTQVADLFSTKVDYFGVKEGMRKKIAHRFFFKKAPETISCDWGVLSHLYIVIFSINSDVEDEFSLSKS